MFRICSLFCVVYLYYCIIILIDAYGSTRGSIPCEVPYWYWIQNQVNSSNNEIDERDKVLKEGKMLHSFQFRVKATHEKGVADVL